MLRTATALIVLVAFISPAWAGAMLQPDKPQVSINRGQGFQVITAPTGISTGDKVMAGPGGHGKIVYADGCVIDVYPGNVLSVPEKCYKPMTAGLETPPPCDPNDPKALCAAPYRPWWLLVPIAAGIGVGICAAQGCFTHEEHHHRPPKSP